MCTVALNKSTSQCIGYIINKSEGTHTQYHGHITALSIAKQYRQLSIGSILSKQLSVICDDVYHNYYIDLYVRISNFNAIKLYERLGYSIYRQVMNYYGMNEHAYDMRLALSRDTNKESIIPHVPFQVQPSELDHG